jgi:hypothetical protein
MNDIDLVLRELLDENKMLRLRLAGLAAEKRFYGELDQRMRESQEGITPALLAQLSPAAREALLTMKFQ